MAKRTLDNQRPWLSDQGRDPYRGLCAAVIHRSIKDLNDPNDAVALGALRFLLVDSRPWLDELGIDADRSDIMGLLPVGDVRK